MDADALVVGAGPAGCAAAYDLAQLGHRVLLLDRRDFPRPKACAGALTIKSVRALRYGVEPVARRVCSQLVVGRGLERTRLFPGHRPIAVMTIRAELDDYCLRRTIDAGACFRKIAPLRRIEEAGDSVRLTTDEGTLSARFLVGADGANGPVRTLTRAFPGLRKGLALEACVPAAPERVEMEFDFGVVECGYGWLFPKHDHINVGLYTNAPGKKLTPEALRAYARAKLGVDELRHVVGHPIPLNGVAYTPSSRRVFLVGDAAGLVDPLLGEGIHNAIVSGQAAAAGIAAELAGRGEARAEFARRLADIQRDLASCTRSADRFYANLGIGYGLLTSFLARTSLMKGFAAGWTFRRTKDWFFLLPFVPAGPPPVGGRR